MTNKDIIFSESIELMKQGKLKSSGVVHEVEIGGEILTLEIPEEIHTFQGWKQRGFVVKSGQKSSIKFPIWSYSKEKTSEVDENGNTVYKPKMFLRNSAFFTRDQVEVLQA